MIMEPSTSGDIQKKENLENFGMRNAENENEMDLSGNLKTLGSETNNPKISAHLPGRTAAPLVLVDAATHKKLPLQEMSGAVDVSKSAFHKRSARHSFAASNYNIFPGSITQALTETDVRSKVAKSVSYQKMPGAMLQPMDETAVEPRRNSISRMAPAQNSLVAVSSDLMRVTGYAQQFVKFLSPTQRSGRRTTYPRNSPCGSTEVGYGSMDQTMLQQNQTTPSTAANSLRNENHDVSEMTVTLQVNDMKEKGKRSSHRIFRSPYGKLWDEKPNVKRTKRRKNLFVQRIWACDLSIVFALIGIACTVFQAEMLATGSISRSSLSSKFIRMVIAFTTLALLILVTWYHATEVQICALDSGARHWQVAVTLDRIIQLLIELLICAIAPFPNSMSVSWATLLDDHRQIRMIEIPLDTVLSMPVFLRLYLLCRFTAVHSRQFQDAATRSIASLNRVSVNFPFVLKTLMHEYPLLVLCAFTSTFWIIMAWILTQCERFDGVAEDNNYLNSLWFIMITFKAVGYGDIVPNTYCGRVVAVTTGIVGAAVSSALIAVIGMKLELSKAEKHVNNFMMDSKLSRLRKETAAKILQHTWFIHKFRSCSHEIEEKKLRLHQRKFLSSIYEFRRVKWDQRKLTDQGNALVDLAKLQSETHSIIWSMQETFDDLVEKVNQIQNRLNQLTNQSEDTKITFPQSESAIISDDL